MQNKTILISEPQKNILLITLHRPEVRNAINVEMMKELLSFWNAMKHDERIRCIIMTGTPPAFCAGVDLKVRKDLDIKTWKAQHKILQRAMRAMMQCPIPIIAAVNGAAFGGGLELTLACDFAYAVKSAKFAQSETKLGIMPGAMGTQHLPPACGIRRAKELCFTGKSFTADDAFSWKIINKVCEENELMSDVLETAQLISNNAPLANRAAKKAMNISTDYPIEKGYSVEINLYNKLLPTDDRIEGINAFNEKRTPTFTGK